MKFSNIIHVIPLFTDNTAVINVSNYNSVFDIFSVGTFQYTLYLIYLFLCIYVYVFNQIVYNRL